MLSVRFYFILLPPALQINDGLHRTDIERSCEAEKNKR